MSTPSRDQVVCAVGIDGSPSAVAAAAHEAVRSRTGLHLVHVTADPHAPEVEPLLAGAATLAHTAHPDLQVTRQVVDSGWVSAGLAQAGSGASLVVIEHTHRGLAKRVIAGSTPDSVALHVQAPVLSVPHEWNAGTARPAIVTVAVQNTMEAPGLVSLAIAEARTRSADVVVLHATGPGQHIDDIGIRTDWVDRAHRELDPVVDAVTGKGSDVKVRVEVSLAPPAAALVGAAAGSALLILGRRHHDHLWGTNVGPTVRRVLLEATCPVLLPPDPEHAPVARRAPVRADEEGDSHATAGDVVVAVGDEDAGGAVRFAVAEARARGVGLHVVHVVQIPGVDGISVAEIWREAITEGRHALERAAKQARTSGGPDLRVTTHLVDRGTTVGGLVSESKHASAIVVQHRPLSRTRRLITWSVTNGVASRCGVPVIAVPSQWSAGPEKVGCVVAGIAGVDDARTVVRAALAEAERRNVPMRVVHGGALRATERDVLDHMVDDVVAERPTVKVHRVFEDNDPVSLLVGAMTSAELVVLGRRHHVLQPASHLGPVTRAVLDASTYPVMLLPVTDRDE